MDSEKRNGSQKAVGMPQLVYDQKSGSTSFISSYFMRPKPSTLFITGGNFNVLMFPHNITRGKKKMTKFHYSNTCKEYKYVS